MEQTTFNTWKWVSLSPLPTWLLWAVGFGLLAAVVFASWGVRREPSTGKRVAMWTLRVLAGVLALFFLVEPGMRRLSVARAKNRVVVMVDRSASMTFPVEPKGTTRSGQVAAALAELRSQAESLKDLYSVEWVGFEPELSPVSEEQLLKVPATSGRTDLLGALRAVAAGSSGNNRKLSGVLLFSDGADNAELKAGLDRAGESVLKELGAPISTFQAGKSGLPDIAIESVKVDDFAFVRSSITMEAEVSVRGFKGQTISVVLSREGQTVGQKELTLNTDDELQPVSFTFTPDQTGRFVYTLAATVMPQEAVVENNRRSFSLKVIRDRMRVLLVVGRPSWDERFLRGLLKQDPNVELISFYILINNTDLRSPENELSLIPFPQDEIFAKKLNTFDVVILQNFGYTDPQVSISAYERNVEEYVAGGGALALIGGDRSFGEARYPFRDLGKALPVERAGNADVQPFKARLTPEGMRHPVTSLATGARSTDTAWSSMPMVPGINLTRAKPGATVLLEHPFVNVDGKNAPVLALWDYQKGRVLTLVTDGSWYWAFPSHAGGAPTRDYERFWGNALRWLVRDPDLTTLQVTADPPSVEPGRPVGVAISARMPDYQPADGAQVTVELISAEDGSKAGVQEVTTSADGTARLEFPAMPAGAYRIIGKAKKGGKSLGEAQDVVAVRAVGPELADSRVDGALLEELAKRSGGKAFTLPAMNLRDVPLKEPPLVEVGRAKDEPLWDRWYWLALLALVAGSEWLLRRRFGYV